MDLVPDDKTAGLQTPVWAEYKQIINAAEEREVNAITFQWLLHQRACIQYYRAGCTCIIICSMQLSSQNDKT